MGQIATFIDTLHLSYNEVVNVIPYRNLVIMQRDKQHVCMGTKIVKTSGKDMAARRRKNKK